MSRVRASHCEGGDSERGGRRGAGEPTAPRPNGRGWRFLRLEPEGLLCMHPPGVHRGTCVRFEGPGPRRCGRSTSQRSRAQSHRRVWTKAQTARVDGVVAAAAARLRTPRPVGQPLRPQSVRPRRVILGRTPSSAGRPEASPTVLSGVAIPAVAISTFDVDRLLPATNTAILSQRFILRSRILVQS